MEYDQWIRYFRLTVAVDGANSEALDLSDFRVRFSVSQALAGKPTTADITVYNVGSDTINAIKTPTNDTLRTNRLAVILEAGYEDDHAIIFNGNLWWKASGRENGTDTFMRLIAATGDRASQYAVVNASIPKGATQSQIFAIVAKSMQEKGVQPCNMPVEMATALPRGKVLYMMSERAMQGIADTNNFLWGYGTNGLVAIPKEPTYDTGEEVVVINTKTGMIGRPELTVDGVNVQCLLNPRIDVGTLIQLNNATIQKNAGFDTSYSREAFNRNLAAGDAMLDSDGIYQVYSREFVGDTRGNDWYANLRCMSVNAVKPQNPTAYSTFPNM